MFKKVETAHIIVALCVCILLVTLFGIIIGNDTRNKVCESITTIQSMESETTEMLNQDSSDNIYVSKYSLGKFQYTVKNVPEEEWIYFYDIARGYVYRCYIREDGDVQMLLNEDGNINIVALIEPYMSNDNVG